MRYTEVMQKLKAFSDPSAVEGMARYGISAVNTLGVSIPKLRKLGKEAGKDHALALQLWGSGIHEARILASMVDDPSAVTEEQMDAWTAEFDS